MGLILTVSLVFNISFLFVFLFIYRDSKSQKNPTSELFQSDCFEESKKGLVMTKKMKAGVNDAETIRLNGWGVGDILEGDEGYGPSRILITAIGSERFLCRWDHKCKGKFGEESGATTLTCRDWKKVS